MKKNKNKSSDAKPSASGEVDIASDALARLADKLKLDLAKPQQQSKQKSTPSAEGKAQRKSEGSGEKISKQFGSMKQPSNGLSKNGAAKKQEKLNDNKSDKKKTTPVSKAAENNNAPKLHINKKQKVGDKHTEKSRPNGAPTSQPTSAKKDKNSGKKKTEGTGKGKSQKDPLFEEIIALGGTEEDLDLIEGIDSDENIEGDSSPAEKSKQPAGNEKSVCSLSIGIADQLVTEGVTGAAQGLGIDWQVS